MKKFALLLVALTLVAAAPAADDDRAPDHKVTVKPGQTVTVDGGPPGGINPNYWGALPDDTVFPVGQCTHDPQSYCETTLIAFTHTKADKRTATVTLTPTHPVADFDLFLFRSDKSGKQGAQLGDCGEYPIVSTQGCGDEMSSERLSVKVTTTKKKKVVYVLAQAVYYAAPSLYTLTVKY